MEFKKATVIWEENTEPPKNYFWIKSDNKVYEFDCEMGEWIESETLSYTPPTKDERGYSTRETSEGVDSAIAAYEQKQADAGKPVSPTATITVDYTEEGTPEVITLPETTHPITVKSDFSTNEDTLIESNGDINKVTITNSGEEANVTIDLPSTSATLNGKYDTVTVKAVSNNTLTVSTNTKIKKLIVNKGTVVINNAYISDNVEEYEVKHGTVKANDVFEAKANATASQFVSKPRIVKVMNDLKIGNLGFGIGANGHYIYDLNGHSVEITREGFGGILVRGGVVTVDFIGKGEFIQNGNTPTVWNSDKESVVNIYDGIFIAKDHIECIYAENGIINIYGGEFHNNAPEGQKNFLLNCKDANYKAGTANIVVYGGKFYGFNPAANAAESVTMTTNFVAEGYHAVEKDGYFEVIKDATD